MRITERADSRRLSRADFLRLSGLTATAVLLGTGELQSGRAYAAPSFAAAMSAIIGISRRQGGHQLAHRFSTMGFPWKVCWQYGASSSGGYRRTT